MPDVARGYPFDSPSDAVILSVGSELANSLSEDIHDAFEGLDVELDLKFKD